MIIETKYNVRDEVWIMKNNKPCKSEIIRIYINVIPAPRHCSEAIVKYELAGFDGGLLYDTQIITTKEELLKAL